MVGAKRFGTILNHDRRLLALFSGMVFDGIVFISLIIAISILYFL
jgi:hypothetical protein